MSKLETNTIDTISGSTNLTLGGTNATDITIPSGVTLTNNGTASGFGKVLQVVSITKTDTFSASVATGTYTDITGLSVSITPSSASNKILIFAKVDGGADSGLSRPQYYRLLRDSTVIGSGVTEGNRPGNSFSSGAYYARSMISGSLNFLDSPATTSAITYKIDVSHESGATSTVYVNRSSIDDNLGATKRGISIITLMEIAG